MSYKPYLFVFALVAVIALCGCGSGKGPGPAAAAGAGGFPPVPVSVAVAATEAVPFEVRAVGTVEPYSTVQVKSQVEGPLLNVRFAEGSQVKQGELLFEIDPRPFQETLRQAEAAVARDAAQQRQAEATLGRDRAQLANAEAERSRYDQLLKEGITARQQYDQVRANYEAMAETIRADQASIETAKAAIEADKAAVSRARLDLSYTKIAAPVSGRTGTLLVHPGNLVKANDSALVVINQIEPVFVSFGVPEEHLPAIRARSAAGKLPVEATVQDAAQPAEGWLSVVDNTVDPNTGTIRLKSQFANRDRRLWPGQFVNVVLRLDRAEATVVPSEALQAGQQGQFVYIVKQDQTVDFRPVAPGRTVNGKTVISKGVNPGETVVTDGQLRLFPGAKIQPVPASRIDSQKL